MIIALMILIIVFLLGSVPIYVSLGLAAFLAVVFFGDVEPMLLIQRLFAGLDQFALMALPLFILAANIMDGGGLSKRILQFARDLVGHLAGGVAMTTQVASMFFGSLSGSAPATVVAVGKIMYPQLIKDGYPKTFSTGLLASAGAISLILPPSITLIIYGSVTGVSVSDLFIAGIGAGIVFGLSAVVYIYIYAKRHNVPRSKKASRKQLLSSTRKASWALLIPIIILGGIYSGIFTPTEAAGVSAIYALLISIFVYRDMSFKKFYRICVESAITTAQVLVLVAAAQVLGWLLTRGQVPQMVATFIAENISSPFVFLLLFNLLLLVLGMFIEGVAAIIVVAPLIFSAAVSLGIDPVHLGIIMITNLAIGMYTPPFGLNIFVTQSIAKTGLKEMLPGLMVFLGVNLIALLIITYVPDVSLFLVKLFNG